MSPGKIFTCTWNINNISLKCGRKPRARARPVVELKAHISSLWAPVLINHWERESARLFRKSHYIFIFHLYPEPLVDKKKKPLYRIYFPSLMLILYTKRNTIKLFFSLLWCIARTCKMQRKEPCKAIKFLLHLFIWTNQLLFLALIWIYIYIFLASAAQKVVH